MTIDLHSAQYQGFFTIPLDNLSVLPLMARQLTKDIGDLQSAVVVCLDVGSVDWYLSSCERALAFVQGKCSCESADGRLCAVTKDAKEQ